MLKPFINTVARRRCDVDCNLWYLSKSRHWISPNINLEDQPITDPMNDSYKEQVSDSLSDWRSEYNFIAPPIKSCTLSKYRSTDWDVESRWPQCSAGVTTVNTTTEDHHEAGDTDGEEDWSVSAGGVRGQGLRSRVYILPKILNS